MSAKKALITVAGGALLFIVFFVVMLSESDKLLPTPLERYHIDAKYAGQEVITRLLKTPSTAKFTTEYTFLEDGYFYTGGYVDAQNSFGIMLRSDYSAVVARLKTGDYRVEWFRFEGEEYGVNPRHAKEEAERLAVANRQKIEMAKNRREALLREKQEESKKSSGNEELQIRIIKPTLPASERYPDSFNVTSRSQNSDMFNDLFAEFNKFRTENRLPRMSVNELEDSLQSGKKHFVMKEGKVIDFTVE